MKKCHNRLICIKLLFVHLDSRQLLGICEETHTPDMQLGT